MSANTTASATKSKKLRSGVPVWTHYSSSPIPTHKLTKDQDYDVIIIGAGISGAMLAEELSDAGFSIALLDKGEPVKGSTAATTALLLYEIDNPLTKLSKQIGYEKAVRVWRRSKLGLDNIIDKVRKLNIACDIRWRSSLYLSGTDLNDDQMQKESLLRNDLGFTNSYLNKREMKERYHITNRTGLVSFCSLEVNPVQLAAEFLKHAVERKVKVYSPVEVTDVEAGARIVRVHTQSGRTLKARHVIFATGYELPKYIKSKKHTLNSTWVFATKPQERLWPDRTFIWEASTPYLYMRTTPDKRVICGGEDEDFSDEEKREALTEEKIHILQKKLHRLYPHLDVTADFIWSGTFGGSTTGLPTIGEIPKMPNCYAVLGYGGNGITFSRIAAELIRAKLVGTDDPDQSLFDF